MGAAGTLTIARLLARYRLEVSIGIVALAVLIVTLAVQNSQSGILVVQPAHVSALLPGSTWHSLDSVAYGTNERVLPNEERRHIVMRSGESLTLHGWAVDSPNQAAASSVVAQVDGFSRVTLVTLGERADVARVTKNPSYLRSGYSITIPKDLLPAGTHVVRLLVGDRPESGFYLLPEAVTVDVVDHPLR